MTGNIHTGVAFIQKMSSEIVNLPNLYGARLIASLAESLTTELTIT